jgi:hypothetical protein
MLITSVIACPFCGISTLEEMPTKTVQRTCTYRSCGDFLQVAENECYVLCSFGDIPYPPAQEDQELGDKIIRAARWSASGEVLQSD